MSDTCYRPNTDGSIASFDGVSICTKYQSGGGFASCCFSGDTCLEDGFCYASRNATGSVGYYMSLCSDSSYRDSACAQHCTDLTKGDVVYDESSSRWACCGADGNGDPNCGNPTDQTFSAPAPSKLQADATATTTSSSPTSTSSNTSSATSSTSSPSSTSSAIASSSSSSGLSTGAKAGIGVGVAVGVIAVLALLAWYFMGMRRSRRQHGNGRSMEESKEPMRPQSNYNQYAAEAPAYSPQPHTANNDVKYTHSPGNLASAELETPQPRSTNQVHELG